MGRKVGLGFVLMSLLATAVSSMADSREHALEKIAPWVRERTATGGTTSFIVVLGTQADTSGAAWLETKEEKGKFVYELLSQTAEATQGPIKELLDKRGVPYRAFWIVNMITVEAGDASLAMELASRDDVRFIEGNPTIQNHLQPTDVIEAQDRALAQTVRDLASGKAPETIQWGISNTNAPAVWTAGFSGTNIVVGGEDTGIYWQHGELLGKYRGWNGTIADHNYNWHDAVHSGGNFGQCTGPNMMAPCDDGGGGGIYHGTHTMGTMVGGDGPGPSANDYGMAYGAKWIGCRNMNGGAGTPTLYIECHQWMLAPTNLANALPDPAKAPHVINNSWGCPTSEGCPKGSGILLASIQALVNAGIVYEASNGNDGPGCGSVESGTNAGPPAIYAKPWVFSTGALSNPSTLASFSSLGPVTINGSRVKPDISAPGVNILSAGCCTPTSTTTMQGTSMAGPHVSGAVALLLSARPALAGQVERVLYALEQSTVHDVVNGGQPATCGTTTWTSYPSNFYGWGRLNIQAAVNSVCTPAQMAAPGAPTLTPGATNISMSWTAVGGATDYEVWRADASASCRPMYQVVSTTAGATTYNNTGLTTGVTYSYYILAKNVTCTSVAGACASATTSAPCTAPGAPTLTGSAGSCTGVTLTWTAGTGTTNSYNVYRSVNTTCPVGALTKLNASPLSAATLSYNDTTAVAGTTYTYIVRGACDAGGLTESVNSNCLAGTRLAAPAAPTAVTATAGCAGNSIAWTNSPTATSHNVLRGTVCGTMVTTFTGVTTPYNDVSAVAGTAYQYWVVGVNTCGTSANSTCATATRLAVPAAPAAPTFTLITQTTLTVNWAAVSGATSYDVWRVAGATCTGAAKITASPVVGTSFGDSALTCNTQYSYYIVANNTCGVSANGACGSATMAVCSAPPGEPTECWTNKTTLCWTSVPTATGYTVYRGVKGDLPQICSLGTNCCTRYSGPATSTPIPEDPSGIAGGFYWYVVTATGSGEGSAGTAACGLRHMHPSGPCP